MPKILSFFDHGHLDCKNNAPSAIQEVFLFGVIKAIVLAMIAMLDASISTMENNNIRDKKDDEFLVRVLATPVTM